jgi:large subunit ribosomal protein L9
MEIILQENYPSLGYIGDKVKVKPGFARNFLIPKGYAVEATSSNAKLLKHKVGIINAKKAKNKVEAEQIKGRIEALSLVYTLKAASQGKGFGSITLKDILQSLLEKGIEVNNSQIKFAEHLKTAGDHKIIVKLHAEVTASLPVQIVLDKN